jgi:aarF domain-containing kinase
MPNYPEVVIPRPIFYTTDILVMQYLPGRKLMDSCLDDYRVYAKRLGMSLDELMDLSKRHFGKPLPIGWRNYLRLGAEDAVSFVGKLARYPLIFAYNNTVGWAASADKLWSYPHLFRLIRPGRALQILLQVHAHEIFVDGLFNGDPHSGNILLMPDGRVGLIDYGQVKLLTVEQRKKLAEFVVAVANGERERIVDMMYGIGYRTEKMDRDVAYRTAKLVFDRDDLEATDGQGFQMYLAALDKQDRITSTPDDYIMVSRVCLLLRGIGMLLGIPPVSVAQQWKPICEKVMASNNLREHSLDLIQSDATET